MAAQLWIYVVGAMLILQLGSGKPAFKIYFMAPSNWVKRVPFLNTQLEAFGLSKIEEPLVVYDQHNRESEITAIENLTARTAQEPNSESHHNVVIVYPDQPTRDKNSISLYEPLMQNALVIWYGTFLYEGSPGPKGTVVVAPDDRKGGVFVGRKFCERAALATNRKDIAILTIPDAGYFRRYDGFEAGLRRNCPADFMPTEHLMEVEVDNSASTAEDKISVPTAALMKKVFSQNLNINAVFSVSQHITKGVIEAAKEVRGSDTDPDGLKGLLVNGWHNSSFTQPYVNRGKIYADVDRKRSSTLATGVARFLKYVDVDDLPSEVLTNVEYAVPSMEGYTKNKLLNGYDKASKPPVANNVLAQVKLKIIKLSAVDPVQKDFMFIANLTLKWRDRRLQFRPSDFEGNTLLFTKDEIWTPVVFMKSANQVPETLTYSLKANNRGEVTWESKIIFSSACPSMALMDYPHDEQKCSIKIVSKMSKAILQLQGAQETVDEFEPVSGGGFDIQDLTYKEIPPYQIDFDVKMHRQANKYMVTHKIPGFMFVNLGFMGFWIPAGAAPARVALGVTMVLTTVNLWATLPRDGTQLDKFFLTNLVFLMLSFMVTVAAANEKINEFLKRLCPVFSAPNAPKPKDEESAADAPAKPGLCSECLGCCFGTHADRVPDRLGRRILPISYLIVTLTMFIYMETL